MSVETVGYTLLNSVHDNPLKLEQVKCSSRAGKSIVKNKVLKTTQETLDTLHKLAQFAAKHYQLGDRFSIDMIMEKTDSKKPFCCFPKKELKPIKKFEAQVLYESKDGGRVENICGWDREIEKISEVYFDCLDVPENAIMSFCFERVPKTSL